MTKWSVETLNERVDEELTALPLVMRGRFVRVSLLIEEFGPFNVGMPHIRGLDGKLWEIRVGGRDGIGRGICIVASGQRVVVCMSSSRRPKKRLIEPCNLQANAPRTLD
jgi:hypothetical protein